MWLFLAIETSPAVQRALASIQKELGRFDRLIRWTRPEQMHLTLKFLGEVEDGRLLEVVEACRSAAEAHPGFVMRLAECGCFPPLGNVNIVWVGVESEGDELRSCHRRADTSLSQIGFAAENRPFVPHLTMGRVKSDSSRGALRKAVADISRPGVEQPVVEWVLMQSTLKASGPEYAVAGRFRLAGGC